MKEGTLRFCIHLSYLNAVIICDSYPLPRIDERLDSLEDTQKSATLDANSGFWQIKVDESDKEKTFFSFRHGLHQFTRMPFGRENAYATFQHIMYIILSSVKSYFALVYLDDIVIFSRTPCQYISDTPQFLNHHKSCWHHLKVEEVRVL